MIVDKRGIVVSMGYNGFPIGCSDDEVGEVACLASSGKRSQLQSLTASILLLPVLLSPPPYFFLFLLLGCMRHYDSFPGTSMPMILSIQSFHMWLVVACGVALLDLSQTACA